MAHIGKDVLWCFVSISFVQIRLSISRIEYRLYYVGKNMQVIVYYFGYCVDLRYKY
jgi:hypothetical protein